MRNIAIIPARSGSKGLKDKNIKQLCDKPLISYTIEAAINSQIFDVVMVSTDSQKYAEIARRYGAEVPFLRSGKLASDSASSWDMVKEVLINYQTMGEEFDVITLLQPTSPLRTQRHILEAYDLFFKKNADSVISVCEMEHSPLWCNVLPGDGCLEGFISQDTLSKGNRQKLQTFYRINGAIYMCRIKTYNDIRFDLYNKNSFAYKMKQADSVDIDTITDFELAEYYLNKNSKNMEDK